jgi:hypothetical protein
MEAQDIIALSSAAIALAAFFLAWRADARARELAVVQMFLALRSRFLDIYLKLPPPAKVASAYSDNEKAAVLAYWHHAFDEWYVTTGLSHRLLKRLWQGFYAPAVLSGMRHDGYRQVLFELIEDSENASEYRAGFGRAMKQLWEQRGAAR